MVMYCTPKTWTFLPAATKLGQGNIFTGVCLSTGGGAASVHDGIYPPWDQTPPGPDPPGGRHTPPRPPPLGPDTPPPGPDTPPPGSRLQHSVNERPVRILLESILVVTIFTTNTHFVTIFTTR